MSRGLVGWRGFAVAPLETGGAFAADQATPAQHAAFARDQARQHLFHARDMIGLAYSEARRHHPATRYGTLPGNPNARLYLRRAKTLLRMAASELRRADASRP